MVFTAPGSVFLGGTVEAMIKNKKLKAKVVRGSRMGVEVAANGGEVRKSIRRR
jgi:hypothetical protein